MTKCKQCGREIDENLLRLAGIQGKDPKICLVCETKVLVADINRILSKYKESNDEQKE